jgi:ABC-type dipeptide/oligopeptide/nickel transport system permease component
MLTFALRRVLYSIPVFVVTTFLIFTFVSVTGDPLGRVRASGRLTKPQIQQIVHAKGLDRPIVVRYAYWVRDAFTRQLGTTMFSKRPIWPDLKRVLGNTLQLLITAQILIIVFGVLIGLISAVRQYSAFDYSMTTLAFLGFAMPVFWLALILQVVFTDIFLKWHVRIFYTSQLSSVNPGHGLHFLIDRAQHLALPVVTIVILGIAQYSRYMRASMLEVINSDYVRTARAKGLVERRVILRHVVRNALIPVVTVMALDFGALFGGVIITETIFSLDGMGYYFIDALQTGDPYPVMAWLLVVSAAVVFFNLIADLVYGLLDPRIRIA